MDSAKLKLTAAMAIFGTIGIFRAYIPFPSSVIAFIRGFIGMLFLLAVIALKREKINFGAIKKNLVLLLISGAFIGLNWILLFEAYRYTSVAVATLCYYMAPVFVILVSPFILKERLNARKILCTLAALAGMVIISGVFTGGGSDIRGVLFGLGAAGLYAAVIILNKFISGISDYEKTVIQLGTAALAALPYALLTEDITALEITLPIIILLAIVGILHTGIAYTMYFGSIGAINAQSAAIFGYIDPVVALVLSAIILKEPFTPLHLLGSVMILGGAFIMELPERNKKAKK